MSTSSNAEPPYPRPAYAWYVVAVLMVAYTFSFIDRQILSLLSTEVIRDLQLTDSEFGLLAGFAFALFYTVLGIPIGIAADRYSRRGIIATGIAVWSLMTAACGFTRSFLELFLARMGVGVGEAALSPPAYSMITDYFPPKTLGVALGTYGMGIYIGSGLAFIVGGAVVGAVSGQMVPMPLVGDMKGWQATFVIVGLPGLLVALMMLTVREPYRRGVQRSGPNGAVVSVPFSEVLAFVRKRWRTYGAHFLGFAPLSLIGYGSSVWTPAFFYRTYGEAPADVGLIFGLAVLIMGPLGIVAGGALADRWRRNGMSDSYLRAGALAALILIPVNVATPLMPSPEYAYLLLFPGAFLGAMPFGVAPAAIQAITPNQMRAQVSAIYLFTVNMIGLGLGPWLIGWMTDNVFGDPQDLRYSLAIAGLVTGLWAVLVLRSGFGPFRRCAKEAEAWAS
ncbi:MAG: spinster family MFS transporter [Alphaproteobacteria bacterium]